MPAGILGKEQEQDRIIQGRAIGRRRDLERNIRCEGEGRVSGDTNEESCISWAPISALSPNGSVT